MPGLLPVHHHVPWRDAPDPDEGDIDGVMWGERPRDRSRTPQGPGPGMPGGNPLLHNFATMLQGIAGPRTNQDGPAGETRPGMRILQGPHMEIRREGPNSSFYFSSISSGPTSFRSGGQPDPNDHMAAIHKLVVLGSFPLPCSMLLSNLQSTNTGLSV